MSPGSSTAGENPGDVPARKEYSHTYRAYVLGVLVLGYIFNVIDRGVFGIVLQPIKDEFLLSDWQLGVLSGLSFAFFYAFLGIPMARIADAWNRVNVLTIAIALWSIATALCGAATGFLTLLAARIGTAVGESGGTPPSHSIISDYYPTRIRGTALSIYAMAVPFGTALGNFASGWINVLAGWRWTFVIIGLPGILVAALVKLTVQEPPRGYSDSARESGVANQTPPVLEVLRYLCTRRSFIYMSIAAAMHAVVYYSGTIWNASFFIRSHGMDTGIAGSWLAMFALIGTIGTFSGGLLADRLSAARDDKRWYMWVPGIACFVMVPFQFLSYLLSSLYLVVPCFAIMLILSTMFFGPSFFVAQSLATLRMRAVSTSILLFVQTLIGLGLGPALVGWISDRLEPVYGPGSLSYGLVIIGLTNLLAAVFYVLAARSFRDDLAVTERINRGEQAVAGA